MNICKTIVIPDRTLCNRRAKVGEHDQLLKKLPKIWKRLAYLDLEHDPLQKELLNWTALFAIGIFKYFWIAEVLSN